jgi:UDP-N-acetylmuramyl tripeptide synthase
MLSSAIESLLILIEGLLPSLGIAGSNVITKIIVALIQIVPILAEEATNLITPVKNIIAALQTKGPLTPDQMAQLQALDAQCDAAFDAALAKVNAPPSA